MTDDDGRRRTTTKALRCLPPHKPCHVVQLAARRYQIPQDPDRCYYPRHPEEPVRSSCRCSSPSTRMFALSPPLRLAGSCKTSSLFSSRARHSRHAAPAGRYDITVSCYRLHQGRARTAAVFCRPYYHKRADQTFVRSCSPDFLGLRSIAETVPLAALDTSVSGRDAYRRDRIAIYASPFDSDRLQSARLGPWSSGDPFRSAFSYTHRDSSTL